MVVVAVVTLIHMLLLPMDTQAATTTMRIRIIRIPQHWTERADSVLYQDGLEENDTSVVGANTTTIRHHRNLLPNDFMRDGSRDLPIPLAVFLWL